MATDWKMWRKHAQAVIEQFGQCLILCDGDGEPLYELPPNSTLTASTTRQGIGEVELTVALPSDHKLIKETVDNLSVDSSGIVPASSKEYMLIVAREGVRRAYILSHISMPANAMTAPCEVTLYGADILSILSLWPCMSHWGSWKDAHFSTLKEDMGDKYVTPRDIAAVEMATTADGYTEDGTGSEYGTGGAGAVVKGLIQQSLDVANGLLGVTDPALVVDWSSPDGGQKLLIRVVDEPVWDTVAEPALNAGLTITASMWWPGDGAIKTKSGTYDADKPVGVIRVEPSNNRG